MSEFNQNGKTVNTTGNTEQFLFPEPPKEKPLFRVYDNYNEMYLKYKDTAFKQTRCLGDLIIEGDLSIVFGGSNCGKSFFAYQLAEAISTGQNFFSVAESILAKKDSQLFTNEMPAQRVIYADFEMTEEKIIRRYNDFIFNDNVTVLFPEKRSIGRKLDFIDGIEKIIISTGAKVIIIDNMSAISQRGEESDFAAQVMNKLKDFQDKYNLTIIVIAHTPKIEDNTPKVLNMLAGSSNFKNFADNIICLSKSTLGENIRYIIQMKNRYSEIEYDKYNVISIEFVTPNPVNKFLGFTFNSLEAESKMLQTIDASTKEMLIEEVRDSHKNLKLSGYDIAKQLHNQFGSDATFETFYARVKRIIVKIKSDTK
jgi:KaiC/GvpD/RAD55 family RecA-like ATPase